MLIHTYIHIHSCKHTYILYTHRDDGKCIVRGVMPVPIREDFGNNHQHYSYIHTVHAYIHTYIHTYMHILLFNFSQFIKLSNPN